MTIHIIGFFFISILGSLLHFTYDWSKHNKIIALFSAVNESTWEHIKIALTPLFIWSLIDGFIYGENPNYFLAKLASITIVIITIPAIFYGYQTFTKRPILAIDISSFFISILLGQLSMYLILNATPVPYIISYISVILLFIIFGFYMTATLFPLKTSFFIDPITNRYGIKGHPNLEKRK